MAFGYRKWFENVHSPHGERPRGGDVMELLRQHVVDMVELLTFFTLFDILGANCP